MIIGLIDVDGHSNFPNLALMKLSAWHKSQGDTVKWYNPFDPIQCDTVYMSKVFTFTPDYEFEINAKNVIKGGTGYKEYDKVLPNKIEYIFPDYSIYPNCDYAIGFLTRGCVRKCPWCVVPKKEGWIHANETWQNIKRPDSNKIVFMDNNVLACDYGRDQIREMIGKNVKVDFNQGLDARLIDDDVAKDLAGLKWISYIRTACDTANSFSSVQAAVERLKRYGVKPYRVFVYVLVQDVDDALRRIEMLDNIGVIPFAQPYRDFDGGEPTEEQKRLARWCNMRSIHKSVPFEEYNVKKEYRSGRRGDYESQLQF